MSPLDVLRYCIQIWDISLFLCYLVVQWRAGGGARLQVGKQLKWRPILMDLKIGIIFILIDDVANFQMLV